MSTIDHKAKAQALIADEAMRSSFDLALAQVEATLALVAATDKQTAVLSMIFSAMQTGMTNHQRAELNQAMTA